MTVGMAIAIDIRASVVVVAPSVVTSSRSAVSVIPSPMSLIDWATQSRRKSGIRRTSRTPMVTGWSEVIGRVPRTRGSGQVGGVGGVGELGRVARVRPLDERVESEQGPERQALGRVVVGVVLALGGLEQVKQLLAQLRRPTRPQPDETFGQQELPLREGVIDGVDGADADRG